MMISGTAELFNDEGGGDEEDDDESLLRDSSTVRMKKSTISSFNNILQMNTVKPYPFCYHHELKYRRIFIIRLYV